MRPIWDNLRRKVEDAQRELPSDAAKPFVNDEYGDIFGIVFSIVVLYKPKLFKKKKKSFKSY